MKCVVETIKFPFLTAGQTMDRAQKTKKEEEKKKKGGTEAIVFFERRKRAQ